MLKIEIEIPDEKVECFSNNAKNDIGKYAEKYTLDIISEAERIELSTHEGNSESEITSTHVAQSANKFKLNNTVRRKKTFLNVVKAISEIFLFFAGILFSTDKFVVNQEFNLWYFILFMFVFTIALIATIMSYTLGGD